MREEQRMAMSTSEGRETPPQEDEEEEEEEEAPTEARPSRPEGVGRPPRIDWGTWGVTEVMKVVEVRWRWWRGPGRTSGRKKRWSR